MTPPEGYAIRKATREDAMACPAIEKAGARMFRDSPFPEIADEPIPQPTRFVAAASEGLLLVAAGPGGPVGFARFESDPPDLQLAEFDVDPEHQGRGVGAALLAAGDALGAALGLERMTLTTFRDLPWNRPYYERRGFREISLDEGGPGLRAEAAEQASYGWGPALRLAMARPIRSRSREET